MRLYGRLMKLAAIVAMVLALTGCNDENNSKFAVAVLVGAHANFDEIPMNSSALHDAMFGAAYTYGEVTFITVDGAPNVFYSTDIPEPEIERLSEVKRYNMAKDYLTQLQPMLAEISAEEQEVNTLKAIRLGAERLQGADPASTDKLLLIMDSGLSTVEPLRFQDGYLWAETEDIVNALEEKCLIPKLDGVDVKWAFCGETAHPQEELSAAQKEKLREIWEAILLEGGARSVEFINEVATGVPNTDSPYVSTVEAEDEGIEVPIHPTPEPTVTDFRPLDTYVLDGARVQFVGDTAVFLDENKAREEIKVVADDLLAHPDNHVYVIGTTASGRRDFCKTLSDERAKAVTDVLTDFGVPKEQLYLMGLGCVPGPWREEDLDENGRLIEEKAAKNRRVIIVDVLSDDADIFR